MPSINPSAAQFGRFLAQVPADRPVVMLNLLRFRDRADYPADFAATSCSGVEAYQRYGAVAAQRVASVGGRVVWSGRADLTVIGPEAEAWDMVVLVEYPSKQAFAEMIGQPEYQAVAPHRTAALADSRLIATEAQTNPLEG
jgi:uncharacterized protein (DUF1330 family)